MRRESSAPLRGHLCVLIYFVNEIEFAVECASLAPHTPVINLVSSGGLEFSARGASGRMPPLGKKYFFLISMIIFYNEITFCKII